MAIQVGGVTVITNNRVLQNVNGVGGGLGSTFSTVSNIERAGNFNSAQSFSAGTWLITIRNRNNTASSAQNFGTPNNVRGGYVVSTGNVFQGTVWSDTNNQWRYLAGSSNLYMLANNGLYVQGGQGYETTAMVSLSGTTNFNNGLTGIGLFGSKISNV